MLLLTTCFYYLRNLKDTWTPLPKSRQDVATGWIKTSCSSEEHAVNPANATVPRWNRKNHGLLSMGNSSGGLIMGPLRDHRFSIDVLKTILCWLQVSTPPKSNQVRVRSASNMQTYIPKFKPTWKQRSQELILAVDSAVLRTHEKSQAKHG